MAMPQDSRYSTLDLWRGLASLSVLAYHVGMGHTRVFGWGPYAVQVFFIISGFCIAAAAERARAKESSLARFMKRRVRRIAPPYLASVALALAIGFLGAWRGGGLRAGLGSLGHPWEFYAKNVTLTQWTSITRDYASGLR